MKFINKRTLFANETGPLLVDESAAGDTENVEDGDQTGLKLKL